MTFGKSFHPPLFAAFPVLCIFSANLDLIPVDHLWRPLLVALGIGVALWTVASLAWRSTDKGAVTASCVALLAYAFGATAKLWFPLDGPVVQVLVWGVPAVALAVLAGWKVKWVGPVNVLAIGCVLASSGQIVFGLYGTRHADVATTKEPASSKSGPVQKPDVINIILDGYGRTDQLKRAIGFDNSVFVAGLRQRGFYVADQARANYCQTELSIASSLNMDFVQKLLPTLGPGATDREPLVKALQDNRVARRFKSQGYRFFSITTGFPPIQFEKNDMQLKSSEGMTWFESAVIQMTPLGAAPQTVDSMLVERRRHLHDAFGNLKFLAAESKTPRFVVAHILAPHPPFVFYADGSPRPRRGPYGFWDGSDFLSFVGSPADYREGYAAQAEYTDKLTLEAVDKLLGSSGPPPIIIIQGDHGSKVGLDQNSLEKSDVAECFPNLAAFYVPDSVRTRLYPTVSPVNYFRLVLSDLFGDDLPLLPDQSWYSTYPHPYGFTEVTSRLVLNDPVEATK